LDKILVRKSILFFSKKRQLKNVLFYLKKKPYTGAWQEHIAFALLLEVAGVAVAQCIWLELSDKRQTVDV
jgi:hypothetical protein